MSDETSRSPRRSGGRVNRNDSNKATSNNRNGNRGAGSRNRNRNNQGKSNSGARREGGPRNSGGGNNRGGNRRGGQRNRQPVKLTLWQKLLAFLGVYDPRKPQRKGKKGGAGKPQGRTNKRERKPRENDSRAKGPKSDRTDERPARQRQKKERINIADPVKKDRAPRERRGPAQKRLQVKNLSFDATESDLEELFKGIGSVRNVEILYNRETHRSKGIAFITMSKDEEAQRAIDVLHDQFFLGRKLSIDFAGEKPKQSDEDKPAEKALAAAPASESTANDDEVIAYPKSDVPANADSENEKPASAE